MTVSPVENGRLKWVDSGENVCEMCSSGSDVIPQCWHPSEGNEHKARELHGALHGWEL